MTKEVTSKQQDQTVSVIHKLERLKKIPQKIFDQFQKAFGGTSLEMVPIHIAENGKLSVFMVQRPDTDTYWSKEWHVPGTMVFPWDVFKYFIQDGISKAWDRLKEKEFMKEIPTHMIGEAGTMHLGTRRGSETAKVHIAIIDDKLTQGRYFMIDDLPKDVIDHHLPIIRHGVLTLIGELKTGRLNIEGIDAEKTESMLEQAHQLIRLKHD